MREPEVIHEDNHLVVIDKPPLLATMGAEPGQPTLVQWTRDWLKTKYNKPGNVYLGVVSRLDAFTCGLIVLAKTSKAAARLTKQFQAGEVKKRYTAVVAGESLESSGRFVDWVCKNDQRRRMEIVDQKMAGAKRAELTWRLIGQHGSQSLVEVDLLTGRKHQIRVQFASRGMPILGDRKYDSRIDFEPGIALQASYLSLIHPVQKVELEFHLKPPKAWKLNRFTRD